MQFNLNTSTVALFLIVDFLILFREKMVIFNISLLKNYTNKTRMFYNISLKFKAKKIVRLTTTFFIFIIILQFSTKSSPIISFRIKAKEKLHSPHAVLILGHL
jgi:hypothetical protein